ncbi:protein TEX261 [Biomphalaria glabrata]|uniref:Protein TEX261 n=2 Tax=Biomphalaria TaxID=6525 RepID=A0A2C9LU98_BIOGL|nr:protein TEX261-like [Biomphalaria glabrata]KAI8769330.1 TEX261-like protein [Biomphalaria glabrata]KAI8789650.1 protein TEX261 [Biomphalaria glabrata]KAK0070083.1 protein TEX261 [Biomphalaria pfeifferi]
MLFLYLLSWVALVIQMCVVTLSIAAGLYYLAELVEEYTSIAGKTIKYLVYGTIVVYAGLLIFEDVGFLMVAGGLLSCLAYLFILQNFPYFFLTSPSFISAVVLLLFNHYMAFIYFSNNWYPFSEILAYFTVCLWLVPFAFFVSLSANEYVLPTSNTPVLEQDDSDVVSNYFRKNKKKLGLLLFLKTAQESVLPQRMRKQF